MSHEFSSQYSSVEEHAADAEQKFCHHLLCMLLLELFSVGYELQRHQRGIGIPKGAVFLMTYLIFSDMHGSLADPPLLPSQMDGSDSLFCWRIRQDWGFPRCQVGLHPTGTWNLDHGTEAPVRSRTWRCAQVGGFWALEGIEAEVVVVPMETWRHPTMPFWAVIDLFLGSLQFTQEVLITSHLRWDFDKVKLDSRYKYEVTILRI